MAKKNNKNEMANKNEMENDDLEKDVDDMGEDNDVSEKQKVTKIISLDCEMVGVGEGGIRSVLGRVSIINSYGNLIYDKHVQVKERVTNFRTKYSGIKKSDLRNAEPFEQVQKEVSDIIKGRIVVGHGLENDFRVLMLSHPFKLTRDTAKYRPLQRAKGRPHSLRYLTKNFLT